ncbi:hypothetical protein TNCV_694541 [Trichonephila clavipes]|nr:hypothetical protein TNCV_694541 [Trichonephila clavipes]
MTSQLSHDDFSYHLKVLYKILEATRIAGFKLTPGKTQLAVSEIALLGRILSQDGDRSDPDHTASVQHYSTLKSIHEVRSFLVFANQFRNHIQDYAVISKPLTSVLKETDASHSGLGAVLSQDQNGKRRVIEYASRTLKDAETRFHNLAQFDFTTVHRPGKQNVIADHLSCFPTPPVCLTVTASHQSEIRTKQKQDDFCQYIFRLLKEKNPNKKTISNYNIDNNTLVQEKQKGKSFAVVIPKAMREHTLIACHDDVGHMDVKKTLHNLKQRYWWLNMRKDCKIYVRSFRKCQVVNHRTANAYGLLQQLPIPTTPWEIVSADRVICLLQTRAGNTNMLVHIVHATRCVVATPASFAAHSVTDALYHNIILRYGPPSMYISDRRTVFTARHTQHFLQKYGITQPIAPPYSPQANSIVERANGIIVSTLKKLTDKNPDKWDELLPNALLAIRTTQQNSKQSPFYLIFGI